MAAESGIPIADRPLAQTLELPLHRILLLVRRAKRRERRILGIHMIRRMIRRRRERRIHYHQALTQRSHLHLDGLAPPSSPKGHLRVQRKDDLPFRRTEVEQIQRPQIDDRAAILVSLDDGVAVISALRPAKPVDHSHAPKRIEDVPRAVVLLARRYERQQRRRQMHRGRHDVAGSQRALHHVRVHRVRIPPVTAVQIPRPLVRRKNQPPGPARVVRNVIALQSLRIAPIQILRHGQMRRQDSALRPRVVRSQRLPIRDQPLKHDARNVILPHRILNLHSSLDHVRRHRIDDERRNPQQ